MISIVELYYSGVSFLSASDANGELVRYNFKITILASDEGFPLLFNADLIVGDLVLCSVVELDPLLNNISILKSIGNNGIIVAFDYLSMIDLALESRRSEKLAIVEAVS